MEEVRLVRRTEIATGAGRRVEELLCLGYRDREGTLCLVRCVGRSYPLPQADEAAARPSGTERNAA